MAGGAYDIALASMMALIAGHIHGLPFVMIAPSLLYLSDDPAGLMLVPKDSPIGSVRDLGGKLLAISAIHDISWVATCAWVDRAGVDPQTLRFVELPQNALAATWRRCSASPAASTSTHARFTRHRRRGEVQSDRARIPRRGADQPRRCCRPSCARFGLIGPAR